jgi:hypothetical protein
VKESRGRLRVAVASLAIVASMAIFASSASAYWSTAKFAGGPSVKVTTTGVTAKRNGGEAKACTMFLGSASGSISSGLLTFGQIGTWWGGNLTRLECGGTSKLDVYTSFIEPQYETVSGKYRLAFLTEEAETIEAPWANRYWPWSEPAVPFTNGSGATSSTFTFTDTALGPEAATGKIVSLTGTFKITNSTGGLVTLTH